MERVIHVLDGYSAEGTLMAAFERLGINEKTAGFPHALYYGDIPTKDTALLYLQSICHCFGKYHAQHQGVIPHRGRLPNTLQNRFDDYYRLSWCGEADWSQCHALVYKITTLTQIWDL